MSAQAILGGLILAAVCFVSGCIRIASQLGEPLPRRGHCISGAAFVALGIALWFFALGTMA